MRIGITGAYGLLGFHTSAYLKTVEGIEIRRAGREAFASPESLRTFVDGCDAIIHLAGMNRGDEDEVAATNVALTEQLAAACTAAGIAPHILFSSSTHVYRDNKYGASKRQCAEVLTGWAEQAGGRFTNVILPNVFGEGGKPFYNSVVSTFCHQLALGETPVVHQDAQLEQVHTQTVARAFLQYIRDGVTGEVKLEGRPIRVTELLARIQGYRDLYLQNIFPNVDDEFDRDLFNTFRSYLYPQHYPVALTLHTDNRGSLFEAVKARNGGQSFLSTTRPGITRGNHFHTRKIERFLVVSGEAEIRLRKVFSDEVQVFRVSGEQPSYVDIPTLHTHNITNSGTTELVTLFWTHEFFDPQNSDTHMEMV